MRPRFLTPLLAAALLAACGGAPHNPDPPARPAKTTAERPARPAPTTEDATLGGLLGEVQAPALRVHFIDVGQGDAALVQTPGGKNILIDSGPPFSRPRLLQYLGDLGVHRIDLAVNSHGHADHIGGLAMIIDEMPVSRVLDSGFVHSSPVYEALIKAYEDNKIPVSIARRGQTITLEEGVTLKVLEPEEPLITGSRSDVNSNSVVLRLDYGKISFLFTGDAEQDTEDRLLEDDAGPGGSIDVTVLKVAHHGSRYASSDTFLRAVTPKIAVVSYGARNNYGHPAPETVSRLQALGAHLLKTAVNGNILMATDGSHLEVITVPRKGGAYGGWRKWTPGAAPPIQVATKRKGPKTGPVNVNTATVKELTKLPGIGPKIAARIAAYREEKGAFRRVEDLIKVKGIGKRKLERMRPFVQIGK